MRRSRLAPVDSHGANIWVKTGEDDASFSRFLQNAGQDGVQEGVHVEVGREVSVPRSVLETQAAIC